ncbi:motility protein A [Maridesulfovibrio ferrireducens]|uniref:Chemotaxis protein MotA n=1 Tax=Maridesulfovibrio ferrireducens TaxID=246191 RepID=A0A1G9HG55_9BACT|nr:MotA/TolQ/ExbB proton channel family protein [Maridesulfovibrio ferrireducens]MBI9110516.1 MotA/TolQ/ExbB proton channel family protein [Maridesulfovibrio ferrireducens]SDL11970.1 chemotaxis protein MotA [Maridesulfovibrio ferrireducens]
MNRKNLVGVSFAALIFIASFWLSGGLGLYWNAAAFAIVMSGLAVAVMLSYPVEQLVEAFRVVRNTYSSRLTTHEEIVDTLLDLSVRSRMDGMLSLEKAGEQTTMSFLKNGLMLLVDNFNEEEIKDCLKTEMSFFNMRRNESERVFQSMARFAPAFGVAGSVIGLIGLLMGIDNPAMILKHIPVAFISTLYGVVLSNMIFAPMAETVRCRTRNELINQKMIMDGIIAIKNEQNPYKLERKLVAFLCPNNREGKTEALRNITRKYIKMRKEEKDGKTKILHEIPLVKAS